MTKKNIAIFASGSGSNAEKIIQYFKNDPEVQVKIILTNNPIAGVIERANKYGIKNLVFSRKAFYESTDVIDILKAEQIDLIVLAGFLWLLPKNLVEAYSNKIINIHPALLPKFGGKGMYGMNVHRAIIEAKEKESGITIHFINDKYDEGEIILQEKCSIAERDTPEDLAVKVQVLEHEFFPKVIEKILKKKI